MTAEGKEIYILYGSQTGNSEDIAKDIYDKCQKAELKATCMTLNAAKKVTLKEVAKFVIFICSTTGNGDAPENADAWWRSVKLRSAAKDLFEGVHFTTLGLGDTNYDKFCHMGKSIDKRIAELGGIRAAPLCCADEGTGLLEETVEAWKLDIMKLLSRVDELCAAPAVATGGDSTSSSSTAAASDSTTATASEGDAEGEDSTAVMAPSPRPPQVTADEAKIGESIPPELLTLREVAKLLGLDQDISSPVDHSLVPNCKKVVANAPAVSLVSGSASPTPDNQQPPQQEDGWSTEAPFHATVADARWLTSAENVSEDISMWGEKKRVIHMELNLAGSGIEYQPGDSIGVCCPNPRHLVDLAFQRLKEGRPEDSSLSLQSQVTMSIDGAEKIWSLNEVLQYRVDLTGVPRKLNVLALADFCSDPADVSALQWLCSKGDTGRQLWAQFVEAQRLGLGELLALFPSCRPSLSALVACSGSLPPRFYSIASSPLMTKQVAAMAFSCVRYSCGVTAAAGGNPPVIRRKGLCTSYLEKLLRPRLDQSFSTGKESFTSSSHPVSSSSFSSSLSLSPSSEEPKVRVFLKPTIHFRLPGSVSVPLILVGPGTGVAPFVGFLQHRAMLKVDRSHVGEEISMGLWRGGFEIDEPDLPHEGGLGSIAEYMRSSPEGPIMLFFGCRNEGDYLYRAELERRLHDQTLVSLDVAMSRLPNSSEKVYVTHKLLAKGKLVAKLLLDDGGHVFICGDGNSMAKDVYEAFVKILQEHGGLTQTDAEEKIEELKTRRRYVLDIWS